MTKPKAPIKFSDELEAWLHNGQPNTLSNLYEVFGERSFAIFFLLLMAIPALPIPTGGITHVFEIFVMILCLQMVVGRRTIWIPRFVLKKELGKNTEEKVIPALIKKIRWAEKYSRPRLSGLMNNPVMRSIVGIIVFGMTLGAFLAPPFSGLDTLPAMGVVIISLGMILGDFAGLVIGTIVGALGVAISVGLGTAIFRIFTS